MPSELIDKSGPVTSKLMGLPSASVALIVVSAVSFSLILKLAGVVNTGELSFKFINDTSMS